LPRKAIKHDTTYTLTTPDGTRAAIALGWQDIRNLPGGTVTRTITDDTHPDGPPTAKSCTMPPSTAPNANGTTTSVDGC